MKSGRSLEQEENGSVKRDVVGNKSAEDVGTALPPVENAVGAITYAPKMRSHTSPLSTPTLREGLPSIRRKENRAVSATTNPMTREPLAVTPGHGDALERKVARRPSLQLLKNANRREIPICRHCRFQSSHRFLDPKSLSINSALK